MQAIAAVMADQVLLSQETSTLIDKSGVLIYRAGRSGALTGDLARPSIMKEMEERDEGTFLTEARDGVPIYLAFIRVKPPGWLLTISIPYASLFAPATNSLARLLILGSLLLWSAVAIAWFLGRSIARSVTDLSRLAVALADGNTPSLHYAGREFGRSAWSRTSCVPPRRRCEFKSSDGKQSREPCELKSRVVSKSNNN